MHLSRPVNSIKFGAIKQSFQGWVNLISKLPLYSLSNAPFAITFDGNNTSLTFNEPQKNAAPRQIAAFYVSNELMGVGIVSSTND